METQRKVGTAINSAVVMAAAEGIVSAQDITKLVEHRGHINITKSWAKSLLNRMGFVKRKCSTSVGKISLADYEEVKDVFIADVATELLFRDIPKEFVLNWDQTGLSILPTGNWTMEKHGAKSVPIAHTDDKRHITAVLAANATGEYLPPQLIYKGKTTRCHPHAKFPEE